MTNEKIPHIDKVIGVLEDKWSEYQIRLAIEERLTY